MKNIRDMIQKARSAKTSEGHGDHLVIEALAGTGKTTTLVVGLAFIVREVAPQIWKTMIQKIGFDPMASATPQQKKVWKEMEAPYRSGEPLPQSITYLAFNRSIVQEFSEKFSWLVKDMGSIGITFSFSTCHSLGFSACRKGLGLKAWGSVNQWRTRDILEKILGVDLREWTKKGDNFQVMKAVEELVGHVKTSLVEPTEEELQALAVHYGIEVPSSEVFTLVDQVVETSMEDIQEVDYSDQLFLPVALDLPVFRSDLILGDEAQDWNKAQQALILKASRRAVICGDSNQAIYGFAGADVNSIRNMAAKLAETRPVQTLPLTVTRRCGKAIVQEAQKIVPSFEAHPSNHEGQVLQLVASKAFQEVGEKDMVLCRVNAPLVSWAFRLLQSGRKANIQGRDIGRGLISLIEKIMGKGKKRTSVVDLIDGVEAWFGREVEKVKRSKRPSEDLLISLQDRKECLVAFCEGAETVAEVKANIMKTFQGLVCPKCRNHFDEGTRTCPKCRKGKTPGPVLEKPEGTLLSSIHRSKGLESPRVFLLHPELLPHPMAKTAWAQAQELNLEYVAKTRAIQTLVVTQTEK